MTNDTLTLPSGINAAVTRAGTQGPAVLLIHGWTCRRSDWHPAMAALQDAFRLTAIDLPGHGDSHQQLAEQWTIEGMADAVAEAVQTINEPQITLVGHSMGGAVALEAARKLANVSSVVLVDTFVIPYGDLTEEQAQQTAQPFYDDFPSAIHGLVDNFTASMASEQNKDRMKAEMAAANPRYMLPLWSDLLRWTPEAAFSSLKMPIHAINGDLVPEVARARCNGHVTEHRLDGAGHFPQVEMPERFHQMLRKVL
ncbi:alpha/beta fold hydrolase [Marinobacter confluentis]|uniref:Alpha/beta hydrolase n=1 Tax=Marinobacter confluentis TaxID=1697557 RepID=A0A4Z1C0K7_9GAMM|nr:alpha/beta hydrolase [Marinobacter confluentis]TGN40518.1 alpha/beta hydrolase [Marinobacter confluentis]